MKTDFDWQSVNVGRPGKEKAPTTFVIAGARRTRRGSLRAGSIPA
jgi:hypothetical protein